MFIISNNSTKDVITYLETVEGNVLYELITKFAIWSFQRITSVKLKLTIFESKSTNQRERMLLNENSLHNRHALTMQRCRCCRGSSSRSSEIHSNRLEPLWKDFCDRTNELVPHGCR